MITGLAQGSQTEGFIVPFGGINFPSDEGKGIKKELNKKKMN